MEWLFFIIVAKWKKSKTVYEEAEDVKLVASNVVSGDFLRTQPSHGDFFFSRSQSQQRIRSTSIIFGAIFLFPIITEHPDNYQAFIDFTLDPVFVWTLADGYFFALQLRACTDVKKKFLAFQLLIWLKIS